MIRLVTWLVLAGALSIYGAEIQDPRGTRLRLLEPVTVETVPDLYVEVGGGKRTFIFVGSWHCDSRSNVYFVPATPATLDRLDRVVRISPEGKLLTLFPGTPPTAAP